MRRQGAESILAIMDLAPRESWFRPASAQPDTMRSFPDRDRSASTTLRIRQTSTEAQGKLEIDQSRFDGYRAGRCGRLAARLVFVDDSRGLFQRPSWKTLRRSSTAYILNEFLPGEDPDELTDSTPLITGGILDSITTLKLVVFLEEHFGITVEAHEAGIEHLDSIGQIARLVAEKKQAA